ncbi:hypothetical protein ACFSX9_01465 [Flavobacterium ardleyense]|uniref:Uncharacterized protein n=1 Tax=Flavobacterium ardleyense TaxID=2038737 RepID=A0ABW5Z3I2_9FLAO
MDVSFKDTTEETQQKLLQNEKSANNVENIVRGKVSNSRGVKIPLRQKYTYASGQLDLSR